MIINQWIPAAHRGDAIGDSARRVRELLRGMGHQSYIYALTIDDEMRGDAYPFGSDAAGAGDVTILHYALPSPMTAAFAALPKGRVLQYHNITPAHFFAGYEPGVFRITALGRKDLASLADSTDLALGDSEFNRDELDRLGFRRTGILPIALDLERITRAPAHPTIDRLLNDGLTNFLFVGRIVPNKRIEDIIRLAEVYKRYIDTHYRFVFVGRTDGIPRYYAAVRALIKEFDMLPERFLFQGAVTDWELAAYYRSASVYLSLSEHEGFCVPVLEAMAVGVPVFAYRSTAVAETLGDGGVCWSPKDLEFAAELLGQLAFDPAMRARIIAGQHRRLEQFSETRLMEKLKSAISAVSPC
jgi:glycosyltransferase involved in cell wall biosynthesis